MRAILAKCWNKPYLLLVLTNLFWGGNAVVGRYLAEAMPPITISALRVALSTLLFVPFVYPQMKKDWPQAKKHVSYLLVLALCGVMGYNLLTYWALNYTTAVNATLINSTSPLVIGLLAFLVLRDHLSLRFFVSVLLSMVGIIWVAFQGSLERLVTLQFNRGDLIMILAVLSWAIYSVILPKIANKFTLFSLFGYCLVLASIISLPLAGVELQFKAIRSFGFDVGLSLLYLAVFPSLSAFLFWNRATAMVGPAKGSLFINLTAVFAALFGYLFIGEKLTLAQLMGGLLVFLGVFIASSSKERPAVKEMEKSVS